MPPARRSREAQESNSLKQGLKGAENLTCSEQLIPSLKVTLQPRGTILSQPCQIALLVCDSPVGLQYFGLKFSRKLGRFQYLELNGTLSCTDARARCSGCEMRQVREGGMTPFIDGLLLPAICFPDLTYRPAFQAYPCCLKVSAILPHTKPC